MITRVSGRRARREARSGANLSGAILDTSISGTDFAGANLTGARLTPGMSGVDFTGAKLTGVVVYYLWHSDLSGADISNANFAYADFWDVKSGGVTDTGGQPTLPRNWSLSKGFLIGPSVDLSGLDYPSLGSGR